MIRRLVLKNWRSHIDSEFIFARGTNVLIGRMGSGKSSAMDAISFALFGTFPALKSKKVRIEDCIMNKPSQKEKSEVLLELVLGDDVYSIKREIALGKGTTKAEIRKNGKLIEAGNTSRVNEVVSEILGMNYDLFSKAVYSEQNQMDYFLQIPKGKRRDNIDSLLGIDKFEDARKNAISIRNSVSSRISDKEKEIEKIDLEELEKRRQDTEREIKEINRSTSLLAGKLDSLRRKLSETKEELDRLEGNRRLREEMSSEMKSIESRITYIQKEIQEKEREYGSELSGDLGSKLLHVQEELKQIMLDEDANRREASNLLSKIGALESEINSASEEKRRIEEARKELEAARREYSKIDNYTGKLESVRKKKDELRNRLAEITAHSNDLEDKIKQLLKSKGNCPVCGQPLPDDKRDEIISQARSDLDTAKREKTRIEEEVSGLERMEDELLEKIKSLNEISGKMLELERLVKKETPDIEKMNGMLREYKSKKDSVEKKLAELAKVEKEKQEIKTKISNLFTIQQAYLKNKEQLKSLEMELNSIREKISKIEFDEEKYNRAKDNYLQLSSEVARLDEIIKGKREIVSEKEKLIENISREIGLARGIKSEIEVLKTIREDISILAKSLESSQIALRQEFIEAVNSALEDIWPRVYPYEDYKSARLFVDPKAKDYILQLQRRDDKWVNVEGLVSGGERSTAALALRVSFSLVLTQNLNWLILDEPTHNLDKEGVLTLSKTLRDHLPSIVDQIFIITHDEDMEEAVSGTLYKLEREKGIDEPTKVVLISSGQG